MDPSAGREQQVKYGGLVVAAVGFLLSRVTLRVVADPGGSLTTFLTTGLVPLAFGLALTAFGISLAVGTFEPRYVNTVAVWTLLGTVGMALVTGLSLLNPVLSTDMVPVTAQSSPLVANTLIGGAVGGTLIGLRSATNRRQRRELARRSNQAVVLNRILRDEVLNAVTAIRGRIDHLRQTGTPDGESVAAIDRGARRIQAAVEDVGFLVRTGETDRPTQEPVALVPVVRDQAAAAADRFADATVGSDVDVPDDLRVRADEHLGTVLAQLVETAVERHPNRAPDVDISVGAHDTSATVTVSDDGRPLTDTQAGVLTENAIPDYDDPTVSFGYPIVSLLVDRYGGRVSVDRTDGVTRVTVVLPRVRAAGTPRGRHGVEPAALRRVTAAALLGGVAMGAVLQTFADTIPVIGSLYGVESVAVGWVTHLFHSVVFGILFVAALRRPALRDRVDSLASTVAAAVGFALVLAVVAAGFVMPLWLNAVGVAAPLPRLFPAGVAGHLVWGLVLGTGYRLLS